MDVVPNGMKKAFDKWLTKDDRRVGDVGGSNIVTMIIEVRIDDTMRVIGELIIKLIIINGDLMIELGGNPWCLRSEEDVWIQLEFTFRVWSLIDEGEAIANTDGDDVAFLSGNAL